MSTTTAHFFSTEYHKLVNYVRTLIDNTGDRDAADIVQDVAYTLLAATDPSRPIANLSAYVYRSLRNRVTDQFRKPPRPLSLDENRGEDGEAITLADIIPAHIEGADAAHERAETEGALLAAINSLDEESRALIIATEFDGASFKDLSKEWGIPIGTLLSRKSRAMRALAPRLALLMDTN